MALHCWESLGKFFGNNPVNLFDILWERMVASCKNGVFGRKKFVLLYRFFFAVFDLKIVFNFYRQSVTRKLEKRQIFVFFS